MRITITLDWQGDVAFFPYSYHEQIQALIYRLLPRKKSEKLHNIGFPYGKRQFKLFTFSRLFGKIAKTGVSVSRGLLFHPPLSFVFASPISWIVEDFATALMRRGEVQLGHNLCQIKSIGVHKPPDFTTSSTWTIRFLSPVTIYSTREKNKKKYTHYYSPWEPEFSSLLHQNMVKKYRLLKKEDPPKELKIFPLDVAEKPKVILYKGTVIKAWEGTFRLLGPPELVELAYDTGLGAKNSQGFGCFELLKKRSRQAKGQSSQDSRGKALEE